MSGFRISIPKSLRTALLCHYPLRLVVPRHLTMDEEREDQKSRNGMCEHKTIKMLSIQVIFVTRNVTQIIKAVTFSRLRYSIFYMLEGMDRFFKCTLTHTCKNADMCKHMSAHTTHTHTHTHTHALQVTLDRPKFVALSKALNYTAGMLWQILP